MNAYLECFRWFATIKHIVNTCECPKISVYLWRESYAVSGEWRPRASLQPEVGRDHATLSPTIQDNDSVIGLLISMPRHIDKKRYWRLVSDQLKLRNFQEQFCQATLQRWCSWVCSISAFRDGTWRIYTYGVGSRCLFRQNRQCEGLNWWSEHQCGFTLLYLIQF